MVRIWTDIQSGTAKLRNVVIGILDHPRRWDAASRSGWQRILSSFSAPHRQLLNCRAGYPLTAAILVVVGISIIGNPWWQQTLIGLAGALLGVLLTVYYVEWLIEETNRQRVAPLTQFGVWRLKEISARFFHAYTVGSNYELDVIHLVTAQGMEISATSRAPQIVSYLRSTIPEYLASVPIENWVHFGQLVFDEFSEEYFQSLLLYRDSLDVKYLSDTVQLQYHLHRLSEYHRYDVEHYSEDEDRFRTEIRKYALNLNKCFELAGQILTR